MPIISQAKPSTQQTIKPNPDVAVKPYKHSVVTSEKRALEPIIAYVGGSNWTVDYYCQVLGLNETLKEFDSNQAANYQMYHKINKLIIKLQGALSISDETDSGRMVVTGSAIITAIPGFIPNQKDTFIADIGDGKAGQFTITTIEKKTLNRATVYEINFGLSREMNPQLESQFKEKTAKESFYNKDTLILGNNPLLLKDDYDSLNKFKRLEMELMRHWATINYSHTNGTFLIPSQEKVSVYDPYIVKAVQKLIPSSVSKNMYSMKVMNVDDYRIPEYKSVLDAIIERDKTIMFEVFKGWQFTPTRALNGSYYQGGVRWSSIRWIVTPTTAHLDADNDVALFTALNNIYADHLDYDFNQPPTYFPAVKGDTYILTESFYKEDSESCSVFERCLLDLLNDKTQNPSTIFTLVDSYFKELKHLEQYYFGLLLLCLIRQVIREID